MPQPDPLRQLLKMADDVKGNIDSIISQGTRQIKTAVPSLPALPFGAGGDGMPTGLPTGPGDIISKLPKLPGLPTLGTEKTPTTNLKAPPRRLAPTRTLGEGTGRSMERQVPLRPLDHAGIGRRF